MKGVLCLILGGGRGTRLYPLTKTRSKPAMPVAGKYRLIDVPISNCIISGINRIYVLTQFLSVSLHRHISNTYQFDKFDRGFVEILAAQQTNESADWYQGTADAVRQNLRYIQAENPELVLILSGDQIYRMDFGQLIRTHRTHQADVTIAVLPVPRSQTSGFGILKVNQSGRVIDFVEKPKTDEALAPFHTSAEWIERQGVACNGRHYLASMGIYVFNREALYQELQLGQPPATDFGKEIFPRCVKNRHVQAYLFDGYWEDLGTIKSYHEASLAFCSEFPPFEFYSTEGVIYTRSRNLPPSRIIDSVLNQCLISDGVVVQSGCRIERSVLGIRTRIARNAIIRDSVVIGSDRLETDAQRASNRSQGIPDLNIGENAVIERAILDKDCRIGRNVRIVNRDNVLDVDTDLYSIRDGIVVIPRGVTIPDGTVI
jgi:glucose-1-phosphate adenylyltransferase